MVKNRGNAILLDGCHTVFHVWSFVARDMSTDFNKILHKYRVAHLSVNGYVFAIQLLANFDHSNKVFWAIVVSMDPKFLKWTLENFS